MSKQKQMRQEYYQVVAEAIGVVRPVVESRGEENVPELKEVYQQLMNIEIKSGDPVKVATEKLEQAKQYLAQLKQIATSV